MFWKLQEDALTETDLNALVDFIRSKERFTQGPRIREFEQSYAKWMGSKYCVMVNSGSSANLLLVGAVKELKGWQDGDEVIVPAVHEGKVESGNLGSRKQKSESRPVAGPSTRGKWNVEI